MGTVLLKCIEYTLKEKCSSGEFTNVLVDWNVMMCNNHVPYALRYI